MSLLVKATKILNDDQINNLFAESMISDQWTIEEILNRSFPLFALFKPPSFPDQLSEAFSLSGHLSNWSIVDHVNESTAAGQVMNQNVIANCKP